MIWRAQRGNYERCRLSDCGVIESFTVIRTAHDGFEKYTPYIIGLIKLDDGSKITGQIINNINDVKIGKRVKYIIRKRFENGVDGIIFYGFKFELIE